jgi:hypothetical protein
MSFEIGSILARIGLDLSDLDDGLQKAKVMAENFAKNSKANLSAKLGIDDAGYSRSISKFKDSLKDLGSSFGKIFSPGKASSAMEETVTAAASQAKDKAEKIDTAANLAQTSLAVTALKVSGNLKSFGTSASGVLDKTRQMAEGFVLSGKKAEDLRTALAEVEAAGGKAWTSFLKGRLGPAAKEMGSFTDAVRKLAKDWGVLKFSSPLVPDQATLVQARKGWLYYGESVSWVRKALDSLSSSGAWLKDRITSPVTASVAGVKSAVAGLSAKVFQPLASSFKSAWAAASNSIVTPAWEKLAPAKSWIAAHIVKPFTEGFTGIRDLGDVAKRKVLLPFETAMAEAASAAKAKLVLPVAREVGALGEAIGKKLILPITSSLGSVGQLAAQKLILPLASSAATAGKKLAEGIALPFSKATTEAAKASLSSAIGSDLAAAAGARGAAAGSSFGSYFSKGLEGAKGAVSKAWGVVTEGFSIIGSSVAGYVTKGVEGLAGTAGTLTRKVSDLYKGVAAAAVPAGKTIGSALEVGLKSAARVGIPAVQSLIPVAKNLASVYVSASSAIYKALSSPLQMIQGFVFSIKGLLTAFGVFKLVSRGNEFEKTAIAFDVMSKSAGMLSTTLLGKLKQATGGTVSDFDLMKAAMETMVVGSVKGEEQFVKLAEVSEKLSSVMGGSTLQAMQAFSMAIATGNTRMLRGLGLVIDEAAAMDKYAAAHGKVAKDLGDEERQLAMYQAIMEKANVTLRAFAGTASPAAEAWEKMGVAITNAFDAFAVAFVGKKIPEAVTKFVSDSTTKIRALGEMVAGVLDEVGGIITTWIGNLDSKNFTRFLGTAIGDAMDLSIKMLWEWVKVLTPLLVAAAGAVVDTFWNAFGQKFMPFYGKWILKSQKWIIGLRKSLGESIDPQWAKDLLGWMEGNVDEALGGSQKTMEALRAAVDEALKMTGTAAQNMAKEYGAGLKKLGEDLSSVLGTQSKFSASIDAITGKLKEFGVNWRSSIFTLRDTKLDPSLKPLEDGFRTLIDLEVKWLAHLGDRATPEVLTTVETNLKKVRDVLEKASVGAQKLRQYLSTLGGGLSESEFRKKLAPLTEKAREATTKAASGSVGMPEDLSDYAAYVQQANKLKDEIMAKQPGGFARTIGMLVPGLNGYTQQLKEVEKVQGEFTSSTVVNEILKVANSLDQAKQSSETFGMSEIDKEVHEATKGFEQFYNALAATNPILSEIKVPDELVKKLGLSGNLMEDLYDWIVKTKGELKGLKIAEKVEAVRQKIQVQGRESIDTWGFSEEEKDRYELEKRRAELEAIPEAKRTNAEKAALASIPGLESQSVRQEGARLAAEIGKDFSSSVANGIVDGLENAEKRSKMWANMWADVWHKAMSRVIENMTNQIGNMMGKLFEKIGGGSGMMNVAMGAVAMAGLIMSTLKSKKDTVVDQWGEEVKSAEAMRGVVVGPTNVAISKVGDSLKFALATSELYLQRIAVAVERSAGISSASGPGTTGAGVRLSTSTPS